MSTKAQKILHGMNRDGYLIMPNESMFEPVEKGFPPGIYSIKEMMSMFGSNIIYTPIKQKEPYITMKSGTVGTILARARAFFSDNVKKKYEELGLAHKTGLILYGIPGTGKTVTCYIVMNALVEKYNAICIVITPNVREYTWLRAVQELKEFDQPIIFFCDECENILKLQEPYWLTFLDGYQSTTNFMFFGCTNHLNRISSKLKRPSRIEHLIEVKSIEEDFAKNYVEQKLHDLKQTLRQL